MERNTAAGHAEWAREGGTKKAGIGEYHGGVGVDAVVSTYFERFLLAHEQPVDTSLCVPQNLDVAKTALFPVVGASLPAIHVFGDEHEELAAPGLRRGEGVSKHRVRNKMM